MKAALQRIAEATGATTQEKLADILEIRQSSISDAKRRNSLPDAWLVKLLRLYGLNPDWVLSGQGSQYLAPSKLNPDLAEISDPILKRLLQAAMAAVSLARQKHVQLGGSLEQACRAVVSEHKEWEAQALLLENPDGSINENRLAKSRQEGLDCIATHLRFLSGDFPGLS